MKRERKVSVRRGSKIDRLLQARDGLRSAWIGLDQHRGLEHLAPAVENALDSVEAELRDLGVDAGGDADDQPLQRLETVEPSNREAG